MYSRGFLIPHLGVSISVFGLAVIFLSNPKVYVLAVKSWLCRSYKNGAMVQTSLSSFSNLISTCIFSLQNVSDGISLIQVFSKVQTSLCSLICLSTLPEKIRVLSPIRLKYINYKTLIWSNYLRSADNSTAWIKNSPFSVENSHISWNQESELESRIWMELR